MDGEITVHQDTTFNAGRLTVVMGIGSVIAIASAGAIYGGISARVDRVERDVHERAPSAEMQAGFRALETRLVRIEQGLDRVLMIVPPNAQRVP